MGNIPVRIVRVGDHAPESLELWTLRKVSPTAVEMVALANQFKDAAMRLEIATIDESFAGANKACEDIIDLSDKIAYLTAGLKNAMKSHEQEETRR